MKVFLDTNILLDVVLVRHPFYVHSLEITDICTQSLVKGYASVLSFPTVAYVTKRGHTLQHMKTCIASLRSIITPVDCTAAILDQALYSNFKDFEDAMQYFCARSCGADYLVTRNTEDFAPAEMAVVTPKEFLSIYLSLQ